MSGLSRIGPLPLVGQLRDGSRFRHCSEGRESVQNDPPLAAHIAGFTEHAAARKLNQQGTRGFDAGHPVGHVPHGDCRYPRFLDRPLNQTHGLMALRSDRHKEKEVNRLGLYPRYELGKRPFNQGNHIVDIAEAVVGFRQLADDFFFFQFDETL